MANETNIIQKSAYLRGLADGMKLSANSDDTSKLLLAMIDCIDSIAVQVNDNTDLICELDDEVDSCSDSLDAFAELVFGIDDDDDEIDINDDDDLFACDDDDDDSKCSRLRKLSYAVMFINRFRGGIRFLILQRTEQSHY